jgi:very-short-patch-repair endonuclease
MARNKIIPYRADLKDKARKLRNESTYSEVLLWLEIKNRQLMGYQFHRQVPMLNYIVDFYCHELMLAIEVDGDCHASDEAKAYDCERQKRLEEYGVNFLRFDNARMKMDINEVLEEIKAWIQARGFTPLILPSRGDKGRRNKFSSESH